MVFVALVAGGVFSLAAWLLLTYVGVPYLKWIGVVGLFDLAAAFGGLVLAGQLRGRDRDNVTGLDNRRSLEVQTQREIERSRRYRRRLTLLTLLASDAVDGGPLTENTLRSLAGVLIACTRATDVACRTGACELTLLLPETDAVGASALAHRVHELVARRQRAGTLPAMLHMGIAEYPAHPDPAALIAAAAHSAAEAKARGALIEISEREVGAAEDPGASVT